MPASVQTVTKAPNSIALVKYMGSKRQLLPHLVPLIRDLLPGGNSRTLDLFAGTHTVGYALKEYTTVWGNDVQHYSAPLGSTLLKTAPGTLTDEAADRLLRRAGDYYQQTASWFQHWIDMEVATAAEVAYAPGDALDVYASLQRELHHLLSCERVGRRVRPGGDGLVSGVWRGEHRDNLLMCTVYWAGYYFGLDQSLWLDAMSQAIRGLAPADPVRPVALACLLHAASYCASSTGHFAQHRKATSAAVAADIMRYRLRSVSSYWRAKWDELSRSLVDSDRQHQISTRDALELVNPSDLEGVDLVYADPPYSKVHYSRFYHVLETMTLYDLPGCEQDGRYRPLAARHQSQFSTKTQIAGAFDRMVGGCRAAAVDLVLSYSSSAAIPLAQVQQICTAYYGRHTDVQRLAHLHSTMGRSDRRSDAVTEALIVCLA